jgi:hypothetical protein
MEFAFVHKGFWRHPDYKEVLVPDNVTSVVSYDGRNTYDRDTKTGTITKVTNIKVGFSYPKNKWLEIYTIHIYGLYYYGYGLIHCIG